MRPNSDNSTIDAGGMLMVAAGQRNIGKTQLACAIIKRFAARASIIGIKVTVVSEARGGFHDVAGVLVDTNAPDNTGKPVYLISEETDPSSSKDSSRMLAAGAERVFWMQVKEDCLEAGAAALFDSIGEDAVTVCESNRLRLEVTPGVFLMVQEEEATEVKPSASAVERFADRIVRSDERCFEEVIEELELIDGKWKLTGAADSDGLQ